MLKRALLTLLCATLFVNPLPSFAEPSPQSNFTKEEKTTIQKIINELNVSVINSYFAKYLPLNKELFTSTALQEDFNAKNEYISLVQKGKTIKKNKTSYTILKSEVAGDYAKIIVSRSINITINGKESDGKNTEAYLLKKVGSTWKVENIFINWSGEPSNAYKAFETTSALSSFSYNKLPLKTTTGLNFKEEVKKLKKANPEPPKGTPKEEKKAPEVPINVIINGKTLNFEDQKPLLENNRILVPLRHISENLNAKVIWRAANKSITIKNGSDTYVFTLNEKNYTKNATKLSLDVPPTTTDKGRTIVPLRVISEIFGEVKWDQKTKTATITTKALTVKPENEKPNPKPQVPKTETAPPAKSEVENIDISAVFIPLNTVIENNLKGTNQNLSPNYYVDETVYKKANLAFNTFFEQTKGMSPTNFASDYTIKTLKANGEHTKVVISYNHRADLKLSDGQIITSSLAPEKIGLVLKKDALGLKILKFYSSATDSQSVFNQFILSNEF